MGMAALGEKIQTVADNKKQREIFDKMMAHEYVRSDPLGIYAKEEPSAERRRAQEEQVKRSPRPQTEVEKKNVHSRSLAKKSKKRKEDIFSSFGKDHETQAVKVEPDGKVKVNYKLLYKSDTNLDRWRKGLVTNTRHEHLLYDVKERWQEDFSQKQADLVMQHNALFRQRDADQLRDLHVKPRNVQELKDLQQQMKPGNKPHKNENGQERKTNASAMLAKIGDNQAEQIVRTYGEDQIIAFIGICLTRWDTLERAFRGLDANSSNVLSFGEFLDGAARMGFHGDVKFVFHKLDANFDGIITLDEFLALKPYMLKEMVRVLANEKFQSPAERKANQVLNTTVTKNDIWLRKAKAELSGDQAFQQIQELEPGPQRNAPSAGSSSRSASPANSTTGAATGDLKMRTTEAFPADVATLRLDDGQDLLPEVPYTMSLFIFRNGDKHSTGKAVFCGRTRGTTLEKLLQVCGQAVVPPVPPADSLYDLSLKPVRSLHQVQNGGTYLLKGKEALNPPPTFFIPRAPPPHVRFKSLCDVQLASHCEAESRPSTSASRPATSASNFSKASVNSHFSDTSMSSVPLRVGGPPDFNTWSNLFTPVRKAPVLPTWQAPLRLQKELTHGGKNQLPVHKRYDAWTVLPRAFSESSIDMASGSIIWSAASAPY
jgi:hypothetical protein